MKVVAAIVALTVTLTGACSGGSGKAHTGSAPLSEAAGVIGLAATVKSHAVDCPYLQPGDVARALHDPGPAKALSANVAHSKDGTTVGCAFNVQSGPNQLDQVAVHLTTVSGIAAELRKAAATTPGLDAGAGYYWEDTSALDQTALAILGPDVTLGFSGSRFAMMSFPKTAGAGSPLPDTMKLAALPTLRAAVHLAP
jgi:hypothetical protein